MPSVVVALVTWEKGEMANVVSGQILAEFPASHSLQLKIADSHESVEYDDATLTAQEIIDIEAVLTANGFTKL